MANYTEEELNTPTNELLFQQFIEQFNDEDNSRVKKEMLSVLEKWSEIKEKFTQPGISKVEQLARYTNLKGRNEIDDNYMAYILERGSVIFGYSKPFSNLQIMVYKNKNEKYTISDGKKPIKENVTEKYAAESENFNNIVSVFNAIFCLSTKPDEEIALALNKLLSSTHYESYIGKQLLHKAVILEFCLYDKNKNPILEKEVKYPLVYIYQDDMLKKILNLLRIKDCNNYFAVSNSIAVKYLSIINYFGKKKDKQWLDLKPTPLVLKRMSDALWDYGYSSIKQDVTDDDRNTVNYWLYSPGEQASNWDEFYELGIMGLGWDLVGDLRKYNSQDDIENALKVVEDTNSDQGVNAKALWQFANAMKPGDVVFAKKGKRMIIGKGVVTSDYLFDEERSELKHVRSINWTNKGEWKNPSSEIIKTLTLITNIQEAEKLNTLFKDELQFKNDFSWMLHESKNLILRGAPGTGKSYLAKEIAADIITNGQLIDGKPIKFADLSDEQKKQVAFVQFHPNYDYSDFVEGLRPVKNDDGTMGFELKDGVFKSFVARARKNYEDSLKTPEDIEKESSVQEAMEEFFSNIEFGKDTFRTITGNKFVITSVDDSRINIEIPGNATANKLSLNISELRKMLESEQDFTKIKDINAFFGKTFATQGFSYDFALYKEIKANTGVKIKSEAKQTELKKFVFIIDEINRGEISKIFGELFYSIDPGYRGRDGEIFTQYSNMHSDPNEKFYIPDNVYIIGTMNDIDRSVDSFDFAMRRRFRFVELKASEQLKMLDSLNDNAKKVEAKHRMDELNKAIVKEKELNENYQIGAAYFLKLNYLDFDKLWTDYLEPLLHEYVRGMYDESDIMKRLADAYGYKSSTEGDADESDQN